VLWGAGLEAFGGQLPPESCTAADLAAAAKAFLDTIQDLGKAKLGDKTMVDALAPFVDELTAAAQVPGATPAQAWNAAAPAATQAARDTASLVPKVGRARPLAERSLGTPDAGATSMAMIITELGAVLEGH
jgi:dihydroxyacetone kinase